MGQGSAGQEDNLGDTYFKDGKLLVSSTKEKEGKLCGGSFHTFLRVLTSSQLSASSLTDKITIFSRFLPTCRVTNLMDLEPVRAYIRRVQNDTRRRSLFVNYGFQDELVEGQTFNGGWRTWLGRGKFGLLCFSLLSL